MFKGQIEMQMIMAQRLADRKVEDAIIGARTPMPIEMRNGRKRGGLLPLMRGAIGTGLISLGSRIRGSRLKPAPPVAYRQ